MDERLIQTISRIQEARTSINLPVFDLPRIAVIGVQSAGKSSVLESIVGFDFLPRGTGIVTRRPLVIQLVSTSPGERVVATLRKDKKVGKDERSFTDDITEVRTAIREATEEHPDCKANGVCNDPIFLEIRSPDVLTLTLIDLPGIVAWSKQVNGMKTSIEAMVREYIEPQNTIILAVTPSNADIATSEAVRLAMQVDPRGNRTIGVLTKVDIMDQGTEQEAKQLIENDDHHPFHVPFQWIPVKNRSQRDIIENKSVSSQRREEQEFFDKWFECLDWKDRCDAGIGYLTKALQTILLRRIRKQLPQIKSDLTSACATLMKDVENMKRNSDMMQWKMQVGWCIHQYCRQFASQLHGLDQEDELHSLCGGSRIVDIYKGAFVKKMNEIDPLHDLGDESLLAIAKNCRGHDDGIFLPHGALKRVVNHNVKMILPIGQSCVDDVCEELIDQALQIKVSSTMKGVVEWIQNETEKNIKVWKEECNSFVSSLINMERRINPDHPHYYTRAELNSMLYGLDTGEGPEKNPSVEKKESMKVEPFMLRVGTDFTANYTGSKYRLADGCLVNTIDTGMSQFQKIDLESGQGKIKFYEKNVSRDNQWDCLFQVQDVNNVQIFCWCPVGLRSTYYRTLMDYISSRKSSRPINEDHSTLKDLFIVKNLLKKYFNEVIRVKVIDSIPKAIAFHLVDAVEEKLWKNLNDEFLRLEDDGGLEELMAWTDEDEDKLKRTEEALEIMTEALQAIEDLKRFAKTHQI